MIVFYLLYSTFLSSCLLLIVDKDLVITTNYVARKNGISKSGWLRDFRKNHPDMMFINGEDLQDYRRFSKTIFERLQRYKCPVERLGMDENFLDVTNLVQEMISAGECIPDHPVGHVYDNELNIDECLIMGSVLAQRIRTDLLENVGFTTSAGIAANKILAKLVGSKHKPDQQTTLPRSKSLNFINQLGSSRAIPGIGSSTFKILQEHGLAMISELQQASLKNLEQILDPDLALKVKDLCFGIDKSEVKMSGRVQTIGLEDRFKTFGNKQEEVDLKLNWLLGRLCKLIYEDGRFPSTIKVTTRDVSKQGERDKFFKESRQCKIRSSLFSGLRKSDSLPKCEHEEVLKICRNLLVKMVNFSKPFELRLLGIAVSDLSELSDTSKSITSFFQSGSKKQPQVIINSATKIEKETLTTKSESSFIQNVKKRKSNDCNVEKETFKKDNFPANWDADVFRSLPQEMQNELMKNQLDTNQDQICNKRKKETTENNDDQKCDIEKNAENIECSSPDKKIMNENDNLPPDWDPEVFHSLPPEVQRELVKNNGSETVVRKVKKPQAKSSILNYFKKL